MGKIIRKYVICKNLDYNLSQQFLGVASLDYHARKTSRSLSQNSATGTLNVKTTIVNFSYFEISIGMGTQTHILFN